MSTRSPGRGPGKRDEDTRFFGLQRECGLHFATGK